MAEALRPMDAEDTGEVSQDAFLAYLSGSIKVLSRCSLSTPVVRQLHPLFSPLCGCRFMYPGLAEYPGLRRGQVDAQDAVRGIGACRSGFTLALPARSVGAGGALPAARGHLKGGDARCAGVRGSARKCHCDAGGGQLVLVAVIQPQDEGRVGSHRPRVPGAAAALVSQCDDPDLLRCGLEKVRAQDGTVEWVAPESKERFVREGKACLVWNHQGA